MSLAEQRITGVEADLRWRHGTLGEIPAAEFVPLAERAGLIGELVRWGLQNVYWGLILLPLLGYLMALRIPPEKKAAA